MQVKKCKNFDSIVDGQATIFHPISGNYIGLSAVGTAIWSLLDANFQSVKTIVDHLVTAYEVDFELCYTQTLDFLTELNREGLVEFKEI